MRRAAPCLLFVVACSSRATTSTVASSSAPSATVAPTPTVAVLQPDAPTRDAANPLGLPPMKVALDAGRRVFTFSEQMMAALRPGATLALSAATVAGAEGDNLIIEGHERASYKVHPGYVIPVPDNPRLALGEPVLTEQNGAMRHAVLLKFTKDRAVVRYTDLGTRVEALLVPPGLATKQGVPPPKPARFVRQTEGLAPGNYAALRSGGAWSHVLLVSGFSDGAARRWFALGFGGAAMLVAEADLRPIPIKWRPKPASVVWAESAGAMRRATLWTTDEPGLFTVKFERAGRPAPVGWGLLMPPVAP